MLLECSILADLCNVARGGIIQTLQPILIMIKLYKFIPLLTLASNKNQDYDEVLLSLASDYSNTCREKKVIKRVKLAPGASKFKFAMKTLHNRQDILTICVVSS